MGRVRVRVGVGIRVRVRVGVRARVAHVGPDVVGGAEPLGRVLSEEARSEPGGPAAHG